MRASEIMRNNRILAIIAFLPILFGIPALSPAQQLLHWTPANGPFQPLTSDVDFLEADGHIFGGGVKSSDDGLTWSQFYFDGWDIGGGLAINGQSVQVDSQGRLFFQFTGQYSTVDHFGAYNFSSDTGVTWSDTFPSPYGWTTSSAAPIIDGRGRMLTQSYDDTLFWTSDFGVTWNHVSPYQYPPGILTVGTGDNLFAWPYDSLTEPYESYFYHSENLEKTWQRITIDSGRRLILNPITWINDTSIWAVTDSGLFTSHDTGHSFEIVHAGLAGASVQLFQWFNDSSIWIATDSGLFTSQDRAKTFSLSGFSGKSVQWVARGATNATIVVHANGSPFISHDNGSTWQSFPSGLRPVEFFTSSKGTLFLCSSNGSVWTSRDNGYTWNQDAQMRKQVGNLYTVDNQLWAGPQVDTMFLTRDYGATWSKVGTPVPMMGIEAFRDGTILGWFYNLGNTSLWASSDEGQDWIQIDTFTHLILAPILQNDTILTLLDTTILISGNRGMTWDSIPTYLTVFQMSPSGTLWTWTGQNSIYTSTDFGRTLTFSIHPNDAPGFIYNDPNGITYLPDGEVGLLASYNDGLTWDTLPQYPGRLPGGYDAKQLLQVNSDLFLVTDLSGIYRSPDSGRSWVMESSGIDDLWVGQLTKIGDTLFASTRGGVYKAVLSEPSSLSVPAQPSTAVQSNDLMSIFPNPSGTSITLSVTLQQPGPIELQLTDTKGTVLQRLSTLQSENAKDYIFNLSTLPVGVYFVSLSHAGQANITEKIVKH
jgi:photosystem II stability/assembly factor-like uncharacterized protein